MITEPCCRGRREERRAADRSDRTVLVTGATSLLGRLVVAELLRRDAQVFALLRHSSAYTVETLATSIRGQEELDWARVRLLRGDVWEPDLGLGSDILSHLEDVTEIIHLARPRVAEEPLIGALVKGVDGVIELARRLGHVRRLVTLSSTEVLGDYTGRFYEDWLNVGQNLLTQRAREIVEAERRTREAAQYVPVCVARHGVLVGHSCTGQMECDAGLSRIFSIGGVLARLPSVVRIPGPALGERYLTVSPVDYVAAGLAEICFNETVKRAETFCLADPHPPKLAELFELILDRVGAPSPGFRIPVEGRGAIGHSIELVARVGATVTSTVGYGLGPLSFFLQRGDHDASNALRVLEPAGITCPSLDTYLDALYEDYRRRHNRLET